MTASFDIVRAKDASAIVVSVAHAGRDYPVYISEMLAVPLARTFALEDRWADLLIGQIAADTIIARAPRLLIDLNRAETDFDASWLDRTRRQSSAKARAGLGLVPTRLPGMDTIWRIPLDAAEYAVRIARWHRPFHNELARLLSEARVVHGRALLIDVHSMPPLPGQDAPQIVIGTRHGRSCSAAVASATVEWWRTRGYRVSRDEPYAGGHIIDRHSHQARNIEALQIEIDRRLYLEPTLREPGDGLAIVAKHFSDFTRALGARISQPPQALPIAAE